MMTNMFVNTKRIYILKISLFNEFILVFAVFKLKKLIF